MHTYTVQMYKTSAAYTYAYVHMYSYTSYTHTHIGGDGGIDCAV